ncbi:MAG: MFS transporter [Ktedonobacteraceae bacterium]|nr:MFS transporter [Ktedonobacteraceae bacterium]
MTTQTSAFVHARRWLVLVVMLLVIFLAILNLVLLNGAIAAIQHDLYASSIQGQVIISAYDLAYIIVLITGVGERLSARYGRKRLFLMSLLVFMLFALLCSLAPSMPLLVIARTLQGLAAGLMSSQVSVLIEGNVLPCKKSIVFGFQGATAVLAVIAGAILGGVLTTSHAFGIGWRAVFLVNIPIGMLTLLAALLVIREFRTPGSHEQAL